MRGLWERGEGVAVGSGEGRGSHWTSLSDRVGFKSRGVPMRGVGARTLGQVVSTSGDRFFPRSSIPSMKRIKLARSCWSSYSWGMLRLVGSNVPPNIYLEERWTTWWMQESLDQTGDSSAGMFSNVRAVLSMTMPMSFIRKNSLTTYR